MRNEFMTKDFGPFKGFKVYTEYMRLPKHWIDNGGTHARDERAIGRPLYSQITIEYYGKGCYCLTQSDGYQSNIKAIGNLNKILYKAQEISDTWKNEVVTSYNNGRLEFAA
jgi:hypothetical protein